MRLMVKASALLLLSCQGFSADSLDIENDAAAVTTAESGVEAADPEDSGDTDVPNEAPGCEGLNLESCRERSDCSPEIAQHCDDSGTCWREYACRAQGSPDGDPATPGDDGSEWPDDPAYPYDPNHPEDDGDCWNLDEDACQQDPACRAEVYERCEPDGQCFREYQCMPNYNGPYYPPAPGGGGGAHEGCPCSGLDAERCGNNPECSWQEWSQCDASGECWADHGECMHTGGGGMMPPPGCWGSNCPPMPPPCQGPGCGNQGCWGLPEGECQSRPECQPEWRHECSGDACWEQFECRSQNEPWHPEAACYGLDADSCNQAPGCHPEFYQWCGPDGCMDDYNCVPNYGGPGPGGPWMPPPGPMGCEGLGERECAYRPDCVTQSANDAFAACVNMWELSCASLGNSQCTMRPDCELDDTACVAVEIGSCVELTDPWMCDMIPGCVAAYGSSCQGCGDMVFLTCMERDPCWHLDMSACNLAPQCEPVVEPACPGCDGERFARCQNNGE